MSEDTQAVADAAETNEAARPSIPKHPFTQRVMGVEVIVMVPNTLEGLCDWAGGPDVVYKAALKNILYHGFSPNVRAAFAEALEEETGVARRQQVDNDGTPKVRKRKEEDENGNEIEVEEPVLETEQDYLNFVLAEGKVTPDRVNSLMQEVADASDPKPRPSQGRKPSKAAMSFAAKYLAAVEAGNKTAEQFIAIFESKNGMKFSDIGDGEFNQENVARAIQINEERKKQELGSDFS